MTFDNSSIQAIFCATFVLYAKEKEGPEISS